MTVDAVVYWKIFNPMISVINVENASRSTQLLAQTTLRNMLGTRTLSELLSQREEISTQMQVGVFINSELLSQREISAQMQVGVFIKSELPSQKLEISAQMQVGLVSNSELLSQREEISAQMQVGVFRDTVNCCHRGKRSVFRCRWVYLVTQ